jgi:hypothetical protein
MKEYNYHPQYKYYSSRSDAFESPIEPGKYLVSAYASLVEPPIVNDGQIQIYDEKTSTWTIIEDHRGLYFNIFNGDTLYNENPTLKPQNYTKISPPIDYDPLRYSWDEEDNIWQKINQVYQVPDSEVDDLTIDQKLQKLSISSNELKEFLGLNNLNETYTNQYSNINLEIENLKSKNTTIVEGLLPQKFQELNIDADELKDFLQIKDNNLIDLIRNHIVSLSFDEKLNFLNTSILDFKSLLEFDTLKTVVSRCYSELNLLNQQVNHYKNVVKDALSNTPSQYITPINFSEITILRPIEIIQTSEKFLTDDDILPSGFVGICIDTGERKFGDSITSWSQLPLISHGQRYRFSKTLEEWQDQNPIPGAEVECYETDTGNLKIGNGFLTWGRLSYEGA